MEAAADAAAEARPRTAADDERVRLIRDNFRRLRGHVILGTDARAVGDFFGYVDRLELELFVRLGMTPAEAIVAATTRAARAFGLFDTGALEAGRVADLLVLDANPLDIRHTRQIAAVYLRGVEIDRAALRARVDGRIRGADGDQDPRRGRPPAQRAAAHVGSVLLDTPIGEPGVGPGGGIMGSARSAPARTCWAALACAAFIVAAEAPGRAQGGEFVPVTDAMLQDPDPADWLMWRRTLDGWGYSPLDSITRENVGDLRMVWSRGLHTGTQEGTPLAYDGVLYMPNPSDVIQAIDAVTGDLLWEHRREIPDDAEDYMFATATNRNIAIHGNLIIDTSADDHVFALDATTGEQVWETLILDYRVHPANQTSGPIIANGRVVSGRSCMPQGGPDACVITAHDATTGAELWRRRTIPAPGEPGDETWGGVPFERRTHVGAWMVPSYDPALDLVYIGTSVTSPAPKFLLGGTDNTHLYHNSTLALDGETGEIRWYYQHLNDHWDLDHPFERILVDTAVAPDAAEVSWINPRLRPGEVRRVLTGIPGKTGVVYTLDRETGEFLWATPTVTQNVISSIDGATGAVTENAEVVFSAAGQEVFACPTWNGGKDWESVSDSSRIRDAPMFVGANVDLNTSKDAGKALVELETAGSPAGSCRGGGWPASVGRGPVAVCHILDLGCSRAAKA